MNSSIQIDQPQTVVRRERNFLKVPSFILEFGYLAVLVYANVGPAYGLKIPLAGSGSLVVLAILCVLHFGSHVMSAFRPLKFALGLTISVLLIQSIFYEVSLGDEWMKAFITWIVGLLIIQSLSLRKRFLHHFALVAFVIGCATLPFMKVYVATDEMIRVGGDGSVALSNPNYFGMWFGFCFIYFIVTGVEAKNYLVRTASWSAGILCLYLMALTVSRGSLLGVSIATVIAFQKVLKRTFLPILGVFFLLWVTYESGIFDDLIGYYLNRGTEDTGRSKLWSSTMPKILESWWLGMGLLEGLFTDINTGRRFGPHNSFLFIGVTSGIIPLIFYVCYLGQATIGALRANTQVTPDSPYKLPLVSFALLAVMVADTTFMSPWHMVVFTTAIATTNRHQKHKKPKKQSIV